jgi:outer membrane protein assembly factor BamB
MIEVNRRYVKQVVVSAGCLAKTVSQPLIPMLLLLAASETGNGQSPGTQRWHLATPVHVFSSAAIAKDGTLYVGAGADLDPTYANGKLYSITPDGVTNWVLSFPKYVRSSPAIGPDGRIYIGCMNGELKIVEPVGTYRVVPLGGFIPSSPAIGVDGTVYVGSVSNYWNKLHALTPDGAVLWVFSMGKVAMQITDIPEQFSSPAIGPDGTIYVGSIDKNLYAITPGGKTNWVFPLLATTNPVPAKTYSSPTVGADGTIYIGADNGFLYAIAPNGLKKWEFAAAGIIESSPAIAADGTIYFGSLDGNLYALAPDGTSKWSFHTGMLSASPAVADDGTIYAGCLISQTLYAFDALGSNLWTFSAIAEAPSLLFSSPAIGPDGTIYVGSGMSIFAVYGTAGATKSCWPMFRGNLNHTARAVQRQIQPPQRLPDDSWQINLAIEPGRSYEVEWSTNILDWNVLTNMVSVTCTNQLIDKEVKTAEQRYYRLRTTLP